MIKFTFLSAVAIALAGCSFFGIRTGTEQRPYTVVETLGGGIEIRQYPEAVFAEAAAEATAEDPRSAAFRMLFRYITGANAAAEEIAMTAPVSVSSDAGGEGIAMTAPVRIELRDGFVTMRFYHPASYTLESAPLPTEEGVTLGVEPERLVAALTYTWSTSEERAAEMEVELSDHIGSTQWQIDGEPYSLFYDPPWTLPFLRRNEVLISVSAPSS